MCEGGLPKAEGMDTFSIVTEWAESGRSG